MKKLFKRNSFVEDTIEAFTCLCGCDCGDCACNCYGSDAGVNLDSSNQVNVSSSERNGVKEYNLTYI